MKNRAQILEDLKPLLERFQDGMTEINESTNMRNDLFMDSLDTVEFTMNIEKEYNIGIPDSDCEGFNTLKDVIDYLQKVGV